MIGGDQESIGTARVAVGGKGTSKAVGGVSKLRGRGSEGERRMLVGRINGGE